MAKGSLLFHHIATTIRFAPLLFFLNYLARWALSRSIWERVMTPSKLQIWLEGSPSEWSFIFICSSLQSFVDAFEFRKSDYVQDSGLIQCASCKHYHLPVELFRQLLTVSGVGRRKHCCPMGCFLSKGVLCSEPRIQKDRQVYETTFSDASSSLR